MRFLLLFLIPAICLGQARVNKKNLSFDETLGSLEKSKGWKYNSSTGDWVGYNNYIDSDPRWKRDGSDDASNYIMSHDEQNFIKLEFKSLTYKNEKYYILLVEKWNGRYKYPALKRDWQEFKQLEGYVYNSNQYNELKNLEDKLDLITLINISTHIDNDYTEEDPLDRIQYQLDHKDENSEYASKQLFPIRVSEEGFIRFLLPIRKSKYSENYNFDKYYFEIAREEWNKLLGV